MIVVQQWIQDPKYMNVKLYIYIYIVLIRGGNDAYMTYYDILFTINDNINYELE